MLVKCEGYDHNNHNTRNGGFCLHNMRMRYNKSSGGMVNSVISHCVYTRQPVLSGTLKFLLQNPWLTCKNGCDFSKHGPHAAWSSSFGFCKWQTPHSRFLPPPSPWLQRQAYLFHTYKVYTLRLSAGSLPCMHDSRSLSLSPNGALWFNHMSPPFSHITHFPISLPSKRQRLIQDRLFVLIHSFNDLATGAGGLKQLIRTFCAWCWKCLVQRWLQWALLFCFVFFFFGASHSFSHSRRL